MKFLCSQNGSTNYGESVIFLLSTGFNSCWGCPIEEAREWEDYSLYQKMKSFREKIGNMSIRAIVIPHGSNHFKQYYLMNK